MESIGKQILHTKGATDEIMYLFYVFISLDLDSIEDHGIPSVTCIFTALKYRFEHVGENFRTVNLS